MQEGRGVLASGVLAAGYCCHCRVGREGMKGPGLHVMHCCGEGIVLVIWGAGVWEETFGCQTWSGVLRRNGRWLRQHFQELGVHQQVLLDAAWFGVLGVELVFNSVAGFSGGVSCPSEVRVFTVLWEQGEAVLFSGADLFSLSLPSVWQLVRLTLVRLPFPLILMRPFSQCRPGERWRHAVHPIGHTSVQVECQRVSLVLCWRSAFHSLCGGLALSWRWCPLEPVHGVACWNQELLGFCALFWGHLLCSAFCTKSRNCWVFIVRGHARTPRWWLMPGWRFLRKRVLKFSSSSMSESLRVPKYACLSRL